MIILIILCISSAYFIMGAIILFKYAQLISNNQDNNNDDIDIDTDTDIDKSIHISNSIIYVNITNIS